MALKENADMPGLEFYWQCLRHAPKAAWIFLGVISTVATYIPPLAVKIFRVADIDMTLIIWLIPVAVILCFILVPFREAFRLYKEKEDELRDANNKHQQDMSSLKKEIDQLNARLKAKGLTAERMQEVHAKLSECTPQEQDIIRLVTKSGHMHKEKITEYANGRGYSCRTLEKLSIDTGLLLRDVGTDFYSIPRHYEAILADYFFGDNQADNFPVNPA
jgi:hypothetical protein